MGFIPRLNNECFFFEKFVIQQIMRRVVDGGVPGGDTMHPVMSDVKSSEQVDNHQ